MNGDATVLDSEASADTVQHDANATDMINTVGTFDHSLLLEERSRKLIVYVPESAAGSKEVPVVFMFHGTGQSGKQMYTNSDWRAQADQFGFIVVFPTAPTYCYLNDLNNDKQFTANEKIVATKWSNGYIGNPDVYPLCSKAILDTLDPGDRERVDHPVLNDVAFVDAMIVLLKQKYAIDSRRLYATGFSNGSSFVQRLLVERSEVFAAFAGHGASIAIEPRKASRPAPFFFSVGNADTKVFPNSAPLPLGEELATQGVLDRLIDPLLLILQLSDSYVFADRVVANVHTLSWTYSTSLVGASNHLEFHMLDGLAHSYPVRLPARLWPFFESHSLP